VGPAERPLFLVQHSMGVTVETLLRLSDVEKVLPFAKGLLYKREFRTVLGLPCVKLGRGIYFKESDIAKLIERCTETLPAMPSKDNEASSNGA